MESRGATRLSRGNIHPTPEGDMATTTKIPQDRLAEYFEDFTKRLLRDGASEAVDVEVLSPDLGDQYVAEGARLMGITYDPKARSLELELDSGDHRIEEPKEVWAISENDGFVSSIEVVRKDQTKEIVKVHRAGA